MEATKQDPRGTGWSINDRVIRLRPWGKPAEASIVLTGGRVLIAGRDPTCSIVLDDPKGLVSGRHASFADDGETWTVTDLGSTNGTEQDGEPRKTFQLAPADVIRMGGIRLIAESTDSIQLHSFLQRLIGWSDSALPDVDAALSSVREMATLRNVLVLRTDRRPDRRRAHLDAPFLGGIVTRLHQLTLGPDFPLVFHESTHSGAESQRLASGGLLCIDALEAPTDLAQLVSSRRLPDVRVRLVVCAAKQEAKALPLPTKTTIELPALPDRREEFARMLEEYATEAASTLKAPSPALRPQDPRWLQETSGPQTLDELEEDARRLVALRNWGVTDGATALGITHGALSQWAQVRRIPTSG